MRLYFSLYKLIYFFAVLLYVACNSLLCMAQTLSVQSHGEAEIIDVYTFNLEFGEVEGLDSAAGAKYPYKSLIERIVVVVDSAIMECDSVSIKMRESQAVLWSSGGLAESPLQAGRISVAQPFIGTGVVEDTAVLHVYAPGAQKGHIRLFVYWRRLY